MMNISNLWRGSLVGMIVLASTIAIAQDKPSREREALRRTQLALRAAQERQSALQTERDQLVQTLAERDRQDAARSSSTNAVQRQLYVARDGEARSRTSLSSVQTELTAVKQASIDEREKLRVTIQNLQSKLMDEQRQLAERTASNASVIRLLEQSVISLEHAEAANLQLYELGLRAVDAYRNKGVLDATLQSEPVLGFAEVKTENVAEGIRAQMKALKLIPSLQDPRN